MKAIDSDRRRRGWLPRRSVIVHASGASESLVLVVPPALLGQQQFGRVRRELALILLWTLCNRMTAQPHQRSIKRMPAPTQYRLGDSSTITIPLPQHLENHTKFEPREARLIRQVVRAIPESPNRHGSDRPRFNIFSQIRDCCRVARVAQN